MLFIITITIMWPNIDLFKNCNAMRKEGALLRAGFTEGRYNTLFVKVRIPKLLFTVLT
jgi:hypothetical protein